MSAGEVVVMLESGFSVVSGEDSLSVRRFRVREALSELFEITLVACSSKDDIDPDSMVRTAASFRLTTEDGRARRWTGVIRSFEMVEAEPSGLSTYEITLVPTLFLLGLRQDCRVLQHQSALDIARTLLSPWGIVPGVRVDAAGLARLEYRVQYAETDLAFLDRILHEAGIVYAFSEDGEQTSLVLLDAPHASTPRAPLRFIQSPSAFGGEEHVTAVRLLRDATTDRVALRDVDFRGRLDVPLDAHAGAERARLEEYAFAPGAFVVEASRPGVAAGSSVDPARGDVRHGAALAARLFSARRASGRAVAFTTDALDLRPGVVVPLRHHPHPQLAEDRPLLVTETTLEGGVTEAWRMSARAVFADGPYQRPRPPTKPRIDGVQSALVVGPEGREIHTDEHGRVRVRFHWDREAHRGGESSCWVRVSQGWAGPGYGMLAVPRVGEEVLIAFFDGDPDQPIVVGRVYNGASRAPHSVPEHASRSAWRSASTPGGGGFNEIMFEDARGSELVYVQAERDLEKLVKADESVTIGHNRSKRVGVSETVAIGVDRTTVVGRDRSANVGVEDRTLVGVRHLVEVARGAEGTRVADGVHDASSERAATAMEMIDRKITLTTGEATITLEGPNITLEAAAGILLRASADITVTGHANIRVTAGATVRVQADDGDVVIQGGPLVRINPKRGGPKGGALDDGEPPVEVPPEVDLDHDMEEAEEHQWFRPEEPRWFQAQTAKGGKWAVDAWGPGFESFGPFHVALMGCAAGVPAGVLLRQAGKQYQAEHGASEERGDPGNGLWGGKAPFGNPPEVLEQMRQGIAYYERNYR